MELPPGCRCVVYQLTSRSGVALQALADGTALEYVSVDRIGPDLRIVARVQGRDRF